MERNKGRRARPGWGIVLLGAMVGSGLVTGCQPAARVVLASLGALDEGSVRPGKAGVAALAADQPIVRRATMQEVPPEQGMPRYITLLPPSRRLAVAQARQPVEPLGKVRAAASGPGVVVAEPVARPADGTARDFGVGCGRWLQFVLSGHGELGKTPLWSDIDRARRELGKHDLQLNRAEALKLASMVGATHVAIGEIQGSSSRCTLTYRLLKAPEGREVGGPLVVTGTAGQVVAALPLFARSLTVRLGVPTPRVPSRLDVSAAELGELGRWPWAPGPAISRAALPRIERLAQRFPLAGLLYLNSDWMNDEVRRHQTVARLLRQAPNHPLILGEIDAVADMELLWHPAELQRCLRRFPHHQLLVRAELTRQNRLGNLQEGQRLARHLVGCAPGNPNAWLTLGAILKVDASRVRHGRYYGELSQQERAIVEPLYGQWLAAVNEAARLDPLYARAWLDVATAACFAGEQQAGEAAFWRAVKLAPDDLGIYAWGLEMYQPKWFGDRSQLLEVARRAAAAPHPYAWQSLYLRDILRSCHLDAAAEQVMTAFIAENREALAQRPSLAQARYNLAAALTPVRPREARRELQALAQQSPEDPEAHFELALQLAAEQRLDQAIREYREAVRLNPRHQWAHYNLGNLLARNKDLPGAAREFRTALRLRPGFAEAHYDLGVIYSMQNRLDAAVTEFQQATRRITPFPEAYLRLCWVLAERGRGAEAIAAGKEVVLWEPKYAPAHDALAHAYSVGHQTEACIRECRVALRLSPDDAPAHELLAEALIERGRRAEARAEWQRVLQLDHGVIAREARRLLAKYPQRG